MWWASLAPIGVVLLSEVLEFLVVALRHPRR
jgi:hypothetical protein